MIVYYENVSEKQLNERKKKMTKKQLIEKLKKDYSYLNLNKMPKWALEQIFIKDSILAQIKK